MPKGSKVEVISEGNGWSKIKYNGKDAYVSSMYLSDVSQSNSDNSSQSNDKKNTDKVVNTASLNVRSDQVLHIVSWEKFIKEVK